MSEAKMRTGFAALAGRPNVGKSSLINRLAGRKVVIVSDKPQTTRDVVQCVLTREDGQLVFVDTPGVHKPLHKLGAYMVQRAVDAWQAVDVVLFVVDASSTPGPGDRFIAQRLAKLDRPVGVALNKIDRCQRREEARAAYSALGPWRFVQPVSARTAEGIEPLVEALFQLLPVGPMYYPADWVSDHPTEFLVAEFVREQVLELTGAEVPHAAAVRVESMQEDETSGIVKVRAEIYVERESQRGILIGKGGRMLKEVGTRARREIEALLQKQVFLELWVKVRKGWRDREEALRSLGYGKP